MLSFPKRRDFIKASAAAGFMALGLRSGFAYDIPAKPEAGAIKMGIGPWLGYGLWNLAAKKDLFAAQGLERVEIINFNTDAERNAALAAGELQCSNAPTYAAIDFIAAGLPLKIVALLDVSKTGDAVISDGSVTDIKGLKGKQVAYEERTTSDILLNYALSQKGMTIADVETVPMPASDVGRALITGKVPIAVIYEPYLTLAMQQNPKVKMIYSAGENPGLISDVFVVREEFLKEKPGQIVALLRVWDAALADYRKDVAGGRAIISAAVGAKPEELATAFDGVVYYSLAENKTEMANFAGKVVPEVHKAAQTAGILQQSGILQKDVALSVDPRFVDAATR